MQFDEQLRWKLHVNKLKCFCAHKINFLRKLSHSSYSANTNTLIHLYKVAICYHLDYGAVAYTNCSKSLVRILDTIQNTAQCLACGAFRTTPSISILANSGKNLLPSHFQLLFVKYVLKTKSRHYLPIKACCKWRLRPIYRNEPSSKEFIQYWTHTTFLLLASAGSATNTYSSIVSTKIIADHSL